MLNTHFTIEYVREYHEFGSDKITTNVCGRIHSSGAVMSILGIV